MDKVFTLLTLIKDAQKALSIEAFGHIIVNETYKLLPYQNALFFTASDGRIRLQSLSGNAALDSNSPYALALKNFIQAHLDYGGVEKKETNIQSFTEKTLKDQDPIFERCGTLVLFKTLQEGIMGGLWLETEKPYKKEEIYVLSELAEGYSHALVTLNLRQQRSFLDFWTKMRPFKKYFLFALLVILLFPVRLSVTAPAEVTAQNPTVISAPFDGLLDTIHVQAGESVQSGQLLASMDRLALKADLDAKYQAYKTAQIRLSRLRREVLSRPEKMIELEQLKSEIKLKEIDYQFAKDKIERSLIKSPREGIAIFSDKNTLQGKPFRMGEKIMTVAQPEDRIIMVRVPVNAMIDIEKGDHTSFFSNVSPLKNYDAAVQTLAYQATPDPDGLLTYKIYAALETDDEALRIGWKGTAKIYGDYTFFGYTLIRRPLAALRTLTGV